jgi:hypothetical protein
MVAMIAPVAAALGKLSRSAADPNWRNPNRSSR